MSEWNRHLGWHLDESLNFIATLSYKVRSVISIIKLLRNSVCIRIRKLVYIAVCQCLVTCYRYLLPVAKTFILPDMLLFLVQQFVLIITHKHSTTIAPTISRKCCLITLQVASLLPTWHWHWHNPIPGIAKNLKNVIMSMPMPKNLILFDYYLQSITLFGEKIYYPISKFSLLIKLPNKI